VPTQTTSVFDGIQLQSSGWTLLMDGFDALPQSLDGGRDVNGARVFHQLSVIRIQW
jgi:hypothetical protein